MKVTKQKETIIIKCTKDELNSLWFATQYAATYALLDDRIHTYEALERIEVKLAEQRFK